MTLQKSLQIFRQLRIIPRMNPLRRSDTHIVPVPRVCVCVSLLSAGGAQRSGGWRDRSLLHSEGLQ